MRPTLRTRSAIQMAPLRKRSRLSKNANNTRAGTTSERSFFDLPTQRRQTIMGEMDSQLPKASQKKAKESCNYLYGLRVREEERYYALDILHSEKSSRDYSFEFMTGTSSQTIVIFRCFIKRVDGTEIETATSAKVEYGKSDVVLLRYLKKYLEDYKHCIKSLYLNDETLSFKKFNIKNLEHLEKLHVVKAVKTCQNLGDVGFVNWEQLLKIKFLHLEIKMLFKFDQILKFEGESAHISSDDFDEKNVKKYLKMLQKGEINKNVKFMKVISGDDIDQKFITEGLQISKCSKKEFSFRSETRKNGEFRVLQECPNIIEIQWKDIGSSTC